PKSKETWRGKEKECASVRIPHQHHHVHVIMV
ncbi:hypothetical protein G883_04632, partial [Escherichia coli KOEGE 33 (68a)]